MPVRVFLHNVGMSTKRAMSQRSKGHCRLCILLLLPLLAAACGKDVASSAQAHTPPPSTAPNITAPQPPLAGGEFELRTLIESGRLPDLRWSDFSDYRTAVKSFYELPGYSLAWVRNGQATPQADAIIKRLENADLRGLNPEDYDSSRWPVRLAHLRPEGQPPAKTELARFDLALTISAMRYISDLSVGRVNPRHFKFGLDIDRKKYDLAEFLRQRAADAQNVNAVLEEVEPPFPGYLRTINALQTYIELARKDNGEPLPIPKKTVGAGGIYPGAAPLAHRLRLLGDLPTDAEIAQDSTIYTGALPSGVEHFQRRHGLEPDGRLGKETLDQLNTPLSHRVEQLRLTLDRWRWVPHQFPRPPLVVNIPEFRLRAFDGPAGRFCP